jgi:hypothetical protein
MPCSLMAKCINAFSSTLRSAEHRRHLFVDPWVDHQAARGTALFHASGHAVDALGDLAVPMVMFTSLSPSSPLPMSFELLAQIHYRTLTRSARWSVRRTRSPVALRLRRAPMARDCASIKDFASSAVVGSTSACMRKRSTMAAHSMAEPERLRGSGRGPCRSFLRRPGRC